jgi:hypothetical protein
MFILAPNKQLVAQHSSQSMDPSTNPKGSLIAVKWTSPQTEEQLVKTVIDDVKKQVPSVQELVNDIQKSYIKQTIQLSVLNDFKDHR